MDGPRTRHAEIEEAIFARVRSAVPGPATSRRDVIIGEAEDVAGLYATVAAAVEYVLDSIERGEGRADGSPERRRVALVRGLFDRERVDVAELGYELDGWHVGAIGVGAGVAKALRVAVSGSDCEVLSVAPDRHRAWVWLGGPREAVSGGVEQLVSAEWPAGVSLTLGEPAQGIEGWRLTHRQARDALPVTLRLGEREGVTLTRYRDVVLLVYLLRDQERARELVELYLAPLEGHRCPGATLRRTLREYFAAGRNSSEAARTLSISRRTMRNRMVLIERSLGARLRTHQAELELALRVDGLGEAGPQQTNGTGHTVGS
jgi:hypothetical protein